MSGARGGAGQTKRDGWTARVKGCCLAGVVVLALAVGWAAYESRRGPAFPVAPHPMPKDNGYLDLARAGRMSQALPDQGPLNSPYVNTPKQQSALAAAVAAEAQAPIALERAGLRKECVCPRSQSTTQTHYGSKAQAGLRNLARVLVGTARYYEGTGQWDRAADMLLDAEEIGVATMRGGALIDMLVGVAIQAIASDDLGRTIPHLSAAGLDHAATRLDRITARVTPLPEIVREERDRTTAAHLEIASMAGSSPVNRALGLVPSWATTSVVRQERGRLEAFAQECGRPYTGNSSVPPASPLFPALETAGLLRVRTAYERAGAFLAIFRTEVALYRYRAAHAHFPAALRDLVSAELPRLPDDPFGGAVGVPLRYRLDPGGATFTLYSVGPDLRDGGGSSARTASGWTADIVAGDFLGRAARRRGSARGRTAAP